MGNQWEDIYLCVPNQNVGGDVSPLLPIIAAPNVKTEHSRVITVLVCFHSICIQRPSQTQRSEHCRHNWLHREYKSVTVVKQLSYTALR